MIARGGQITVSGGMSEPVWVTRDLVLVLHDRLLAEHGGALRLRDEGLLDSALARPRSSTATSASPS